MPLNIACQQPAHNTVFTDTSVCPARNYWPSVITIFCINYNKKLFAFVINYIRL